MNHEHIVHRDSEVTYTSNVGLYQDCVIEYVQIGRPAGGEIPGNTLGSSSSANLTDIIKWDVYLP